MQFFNRMEAILNSFYYNMESEFHIWIPLPEYIYRPDFDRISILETFII